VRHLLFSLLVVVGLPTGQASAVSFPRLAIAGPTDLVAERTAAGLDQAGPGSAPAPPGPAWRLVPSSAAQQPRWLGILYIVVSLLPLLYGWRLIRWITALSLAAMLGTLTFHALLQRSDVTIAACGAGLAAVLAAVVGFYLYQAMVAVQGALLGLWVASAIAAHLSAAWHTAALFLALGLALIGLVVGWNGAALTAIVVTVLNGAVLGAYGMIILCRPADDLHLLVLAGTTLCTDIVLGLIVQLRALDRE
jgi:hypothetical protein